MYLKSHTCVLEIQDRATQIKQAKPSIKDFDLVLQLAAEFITDDIKDVGLGKVTKADNEAYFKVLQWDSANAFRTNVGLPAKDFHITVGFKTADIHDVKKDTTALLYK